MLKKLTTALVQLWFRLKRPMTLGVRIMATNGAGEICLVRHTYTQGWHLPGGGVERGETCLEAAIKEVREEAGLVVLEADMVLVSIHANFVNFPGDHVLFYRTQVWTTTSTDNAHEIAECRFFAPDALPEDTTPGTKRRIKSAVTQSPDSPLW